MNLKKLLLQDIYKISKEKKSNIFFNSLKSLSIFHQKKSKIYRKIIRGLNLKLNKVNKLEKLPMLPVSLFKKFDLISVKKKEVVKTMVSSGTSNSSVSKIFLDKENARNQSRVLDKIVKSILGNERIPMLIVDQNPIFSSDKTFNAKLAAIYGFSIFGKKHCYLLNKDKEIDYKKLNNFLNEFGSQKFLIFGFTSFIFKYLIDKLSIKFLKNNFQNGILIHGGGWKKLENKKISNKIFKLKLRKKTKIKKIYNYYGMVEQTGSIFFESEKCGFFHTSIFSDIIIRDKDFNVLPKNKEGIIQLLSILPKSYPGHNILTEDIGEIKGEDDCICGLKGKYFTVKGRIKEAEIRGCSDVG